MLYLRRGNGTGGFLEGPCGRGTPSNGSGSQQPAAPFRQTCRLLSEVAAVAWSLEPSYPCALSRVRGKIIMGSIITSTD
eukprot:COSAG01_NODE_10587_length_2127_cov_1.615081_4_plen_79_part_00